DTKTMAEDWWKRAELVCAQIERWLHPHLGNELVAAMAAWLPYYPTRCLERLRKVCNAGSKTGLLYERLVVSDVIKILKTCLAEHRDLLASESAFLRDFAAVLEALLNTANAEALAMAASLDEFYR